ncbi:MAG: hypothetical protein J6Q69_05975 [Clostridia bacterium]|nr:hypothetical protein [Clostridia bacterium]
MLKRLISLLLFISCLLGLVACGDEEEGFKTYSSEELSITLSDSFYQVEDPNSNLLLSNGKMTVSFKRLSFIDAEASGISAAYSDVRFANFFLENSGIDSEVYMRADTPYYTYYSEGETRLFCLASFYRTPYAYFILIFATSASLERSARDEIFAALETVEYDIVD